VQEIKTNISARIRKHS